MKKRNSNFIMENTKNQWVKLIMQEKGYTEITATWMSNRIEALINHMQYGHAVIAYRRAIDGEFQFVKATLIITGMISNGNMKEIKYKKLSCIGM